MSKKKHTTYPVGPLSFTRMREALRGETDIWSWRRFFSGSISESYKALGIFGVEAEYPNTIEGARNNLLNARETLVGIGTLMRYAGTGHIREIAVQSVDPYPISMFYLILPRIQAGVSWDFGVETSQPIYWPIYAVFHVRATQFLGEIQDRGVSRAIDLTASLPANYDTALHLYRIVIFPSRAEFYIDLTLVGHIDFQLPYVSTDACAFIVQGSPVGIDGLVGFILLQRWNAPYLQDYFEDATADWNNRVLAGGENTSAVVAWAYSEKTIYFHSTVAGTLTIQVLEPNGTWRTYETVAIVAATLEPYVMSATANQVRLSFNNAATVTAWYEFRNPV